MYAHIVFHLIIMKFSRVLQIKAWSSFKETLYF